MNSDKKITLNNDTYASNPGKVEFNKRVWLKHFFLVPFLIVLSIITSIILMVMVSLYFSILVFVTIFIHEIYWVKFKEHFTADSNGGVIISTSPPLAAVSTNLSKYGGNYPVIKIIDFKVRRPISIGEKIATVAVYKGSGDEMLHWSDFYPLPVEYATNNQDEINTALLSYPSEQWEDIERGVAELKTPYKIGLYKVEKSSSDWGL